MRIIPLAGAEAAALVDRLGTFTALKDMPRAEIEWLVSHGQYRSHEAGEVMLTPSDDANEMIVQLSGRIVVYFGEAAGRRHPMESRAGSITGLLPFSRLKRPPTDVVCEESAELLTIHRQQFPDLIRECPVLTESLVHTMVDRARRFSAASWQDEKVMSLGRLAAGLAHELNNPASAAASSAERLTRTLSELGHAAHRVGMTTLEAEDRARVMALVGRAETAGRNPLLQGLARADRIEHIADWLIARGADDVDAESLVDGGVEPDDLDALAARITGDALASAVTWVATAACASVVTADLERATRRIHDVVSAVRNFTHLDRAPVREPTDVARGIADTIAVLSPKAREKGVALQFDAPAEPRSINAVTADLNHMWSCLIENAIDAVDAGGEVVVRAALTDQATIVDVIDSGPGIPAEIQSRIFDPFFTTKPVGQGTGLGLDIVRRVAHAHGGDVQFESQPGRTAFRVRLPAASGRG